ncbi:MAG: DNRLRE domain-containing protein [Calditrichaeota bacterium]|nr:DNRLRE domain-containing protein [Calditrichota bacterium]
MTSYRLNLGLLWLLIQILFLIPAYSQAPEEVIASRTARSKVFFDRENDTYFTRLYTKPVHYRDTSGCFREIDSRVVASSHPDYAYEVARGPFKAYFKEDPLATESIRIEAASGQAISFRLAGAGYFDVSTRQRHLFTNLQTPAVAVSENALTYQNLLPGWLMRFSYHSNRLKEEIVLNQSARSLLPDPAGFNFNSDSTLVGFITELTFNDSLKAFIDDSIEVSLNDFSRRKPVCFRALNRQARFVLPRDFAYLKAGGPDSLEAGYRLNNLKRRIMRLNGKIFVISAVPYAWLQSLPEGEVVIDPTLQVLEAAEDTWIENSNNYGSDSRLIVGRVLGSSAIKRSVLKFPIDELPPYANITRADLNIYYHGIGGLSVNFINRNVRVSAVYTAWDEATATAETPWDTTLGSFGSGPSSGADFESEYADEVLYTADRPLWKVFNIPCIVHDWLSGEYANNGVVLWADNEDVAATDLRMRSSEYDSLHPYLEVQYTLPSISKKLYIKDHLGSTRVVLDESGTVTESYDYYPFGLEMPGRVYVQGTADTRNKFTGKERDGETNWDYFGARYYDSAMGRWMAVDPLESKYPGWSPYNYTFNNPIDFFDPDGKEGLSAAIRQDQRVSRYLNGKISREQYLEEIYAEGTAALIGVGFISIGRVADGIIGIAQDIVTGDFGWGSLLNVLPGGDEIRDARKVISKFNELSSIKGLTKGDLQRLNVAGEVKLGQKTIKEANKPLSEGGAAIEGTFTGKTKVVRLTDIGDGKFQVTVTEVINGEVGKSHTTMGTAKELGIKNIEELTKKGPGFDGHPLVEKE